MEESPHDRGRKKAKAGGDELDVETESKEG